MRFGIAGIGLQLGDRPLLDALRGEAESHADFPVEGWDGFCRWIPPSRGPLASGWTPESRVSTPEFTRQDAVIAWLLLLQGVDSNRGGLPKNTLCR